MPHQNFNERSTRVWLRVEVGMVAHRAPGCVPRVSYQVFYVVLFEALPWEEAQTNDLHFGMSFLFCAVAFAQLKGCFCSVLWPPHN